MSRPGFFRVPVKGLQARMGFRIGTEVFAVLLFPLFAASLLLFP